MLPRTSGPEPPFTMEKVLTFLRRLHDNNNREWFNAHKDEYLEAKEIFARFALELADGIRKFDSSIGNLSLNDITYRIYRDVRFSKNKAPYKCHMGAFICPGGKKSGYSGYYFHVSASDEEGWESGHIIASGDYMTDPKVLKILREDILYGNGDFREILKKADSRMQLDTATSLKKVPAGFPADSPDAEYFRLKNFSLAWKPDDDFILAPDLKERVLEIFRTTTPFISYVNRAIGYAKEEL